MTKYRLENRTFEDLHKNLKLPSFQRALVWTRPQKKEFVNTLKDGFPFGSILLYEYKGEKKYSLIDGLQRFTTMMDFNDNPIDYIEIDKYADQLAELYENQPDRTKQEISRIAKREILEIIKRKHNSKSKIPIAELADKICNYFPFLKEKREEIMQLQADVIGYFDDQLNIKEVSIPCIVFLGDESELAEVFQRLNSGGKKLSKYQVFAAQWDRYDLHLGEGDYSKQILDKIIKRYESLNQDRGILIENFDPEEMKESREVNLSEFCYGLGNIIADNLNVFFGKVNEDICNEMGFHTMLIIFKLQTNQMNFLSEKHEYLKESNNLEKIIERIIEVYRKINNRFEEMFTYKTSSKKKKYETNSFTRLQILSFFASLWTVSYNINLDDKGNMRISAIDNKKQNSKTILENIVTYAIYDVIRSYWSGTGDRKLMDIYINSHNRYLNKLEKETFENELYSWNEEMTSKKSVNIQSDEKMILTCISNFQHTFYNRINDNFDGEHIFARRKYNIHKGYGTIPAGSLGNIMLLDENNNRKKKDSYLYQIFDDNKINQQGTIEHDYIKYSCYPEKKTIDNVESDIINHSYESLIQMIKKRGEQLIEMLSNYLYNNCN